ncbi:GntR family transcriptional regulator [Chimaeribacter arupi]|uniref:GntR family transcriptional regulator n=2 Tax=Yersiniaceae TaxID=1903411 RepID=A0A2N5EPM1_9GAMM|nr:MULTISPECIES: GntR family transcriptional regulator [Yersiniaceae]MBS0967953.1 GntR family transcriptional regulator [Nissabacter archeti]PLR37189.1 GntR family transcriptional regulator [Chimaeribacter arupi]PLR50461.1 GntR family transcriptional regulator [Chimaeribacter arupi]PLR51234.1 GntR family transcriptional regulator [Chimaeribacter arupi]WKZ92468.1 GntR family transcriptional regulator [Chimaeribacter arupi]
MQLAGHPTKARPEGLAERIYQQLKQEIFDFRLLPGDRFSESEIAGRMAASRTPVRQALFWLEREGYVEVHFRSGWQVKPFDFAYFEQLYDLRIVLELEAVKRLCARHGETLPALLLPVVDFWVDQPPLPDGAEVSRFDETFHMALVEAVGNGEMARIHRDLTEKIRIIRRLDFTQGARVDATYREHAAVLHAIMQRRTDEAQRLLHDHIAVSKAEVRKITLHRLHEARTAPPGAEEEPGARPARRS